MTAKELRQLFKNNSDCYADTGRFEDDGSFTLGKVVQAMTEDVFVGLMEEYAKQQAIEFCAFVGKNFERIVYDKLDDEQIYEQWKRQ